VQFLRARLQAAAGSLDDVAGFYGGRVGVTELEFEPVDGARPFYHFALRVPKNRFEAARDWLADRSPLLSGPGGETTFEFDFWDAQACYALDPADNILELIAHRRLPEESTAEGPFSADELIGMCELGLVVSSRSTGAEALAPLGIELSSGTLDEPGGLAFMGGLDGMLILSEPGRGWIPIDRPAEPWPVDVTVAGPVDSQAAFDGHVVRSVQRSASPSAPA
jgi:hypothetical protein